MFQKTYPLTTFGSLAILITFLAAIGAPPRLFVLGDSISIQYGPYLQEFLGDKVEYDRKRNDGGVDPGYRVNKGGKRWRLPDGTGISA